MKSRIAFTVASLVLGLLLALPLSVKGQQVADNPSATPAAAGKSDSPSKTQAPDPPKTFKTAFKVNIELGYQFTDVSGERPSKFEEFREMRDGFLFRKFRFASNPEGNPFFFRLIGRSPSELDQRYLLDVGKYGSYRTTIEYSELPHLYSTGARTFHVNAGNGYLAVADDVQQLFQNTPTADLPNVVKNTLSTRSFLLDPKTKRQTLEWNQKFNLTENLSFRLKFINQRKFGSRPLGTGSYERIGTAAGDTFVALSAELPEPVEWRTNIVTAGLGYTTRRWGVNFDYTFSKFNNRVTNLIYDNPFRSTDLQATGTGGVFNRMGFARGIQSLAPDNSSNAYLLSFYFNVTERTRWASAIGWSFWRQNDTFGPYTLNSAIVTSGLPAGTSAINVNSLPRPSLHGEVDNFTNDHLLTSQLMKRIRVNLHYRSFDMQNKTEEIIFPGYAAYLESYWRTNINTKPIENEPVSYLRQTATAEAVIDIAKQLSLQMEYRWEGMNRVNRQVARSNENAFGTMLTYKPNNKFNSRLSYDYADRQPRVYDPGILEYKFLRMFDQSARVRNNFNWQWQYFVSPTLGLSGTFSYLNDDFDETDFGMTRYNQGAGTVDLLYTGYENTTIYANYSRERYGSVMQTMSKTAVPFDLANRWNRDETDVLDSVGVGITSYLLKDKLFFDLHYAYTYGKTIINTSNPGVPLANSLLNALAQPFPLVKTRFNEINLDANYQITPNLALGMRYIHDPYRLNDFAWNDLKPYPVDVLDTQSEGRRFLLLDSRYTNYNANTYSVYLRITR